MAKILGLVPNGPAFAPASSALVVVDEATTDAVELSVYDLAASRYIGATDGIGSTAFYRATRSTTPGRTGYVLGPEVTRHLRLDAAFTIASRDGSLRGDVVSRVSTHHSAEPQSGIGFLRDAGPAPLRPPPPPAPREPPPPHEPQPAQPLPLPLPLPPAEPPRMPEALPRLPEPAPLPPEPLMLPEGSPPAPLPVERPPPMPLPVRLAGDLTLSAFARRLALLLVLLSMARAAMTVLAVIGGLSIYVHNWPLILGLTALPTALEFAVGRLVVGAFPRSPGGLLPLAIVTILVELPGLVVGVAGLLDLGRGHYPSASDWPFAFGLFGQLCALTPPALVCLALLLRERHAAPPRTSLAPGTHIS